MPLLEARDIHKTYLSPAGPLEVLSGVDLTIGDGEGVAILGPSGCGKSTFLQILGALDSPSSGSVTFDGVNPFSLDEPAQAAFRNTHVGFIFQDHCLLPQLSLLDNVLVPLLAGAPDPDAPARGQALLDEVGLGDRLDHRPAELSGGEKQRAAVARALIRQPKLLLCDEPTGNLDPLSAAAVADLLERMRTAHGAALVAVTHSAALAARFHRRYELRQGKLLRTHPIY